MLDNAVVVDDVEVAKLVVDMLNDVVVDLLALVAVLVVALVVAP